MVFSVEPSNEDFLYIMRIEQVTYVVSYEVNKKLNHIWNVQHEGFTCPLKLKNIVLVKSDL